MAHSVSVASAKARLAQWIRVAEDGEPVLITQHGKPVAVLVSLADAGPVLEGKKRGDVGGLLDLGGLDEDGGFAELLEREVAARGLPRELPELE